MQDPAIQKAVTDLRVELAQFRQFHQKLSGTASIPYLDELKIVVEQAIRIVERLLSHLEDPLLSSNREINLNSVFGKTPGQGALAASFTGLRCEVNEKRGESTFYAVDYVSAYPNRFAYTDTDSVEVCDGCLHKRRQHCKDCGACTFVGRSPVRDAHLHCGCKKFFPAKTPT